MTEGDKYICVKEYWVVPLGAVGILRKFISKRKFSQDSKETEWTIECPVTLTDISFKVWLNFGDVKQFFEKEVD